MFSLHPNRLHWIQRVVVGNKYESFYRHLSLPYVSRSFSFARAALSSFHSATQCSSLTQTQARSTNSLLSSTLQQRGTFLSTSAQRILSFHQSKSSQRQFSFLARLIEHRRKRTRDKSSSKKRVRGAVRVTPGGHVSYHEDEQYPRLPSIPWTYDREFAKQTDWELFKQVAYVNGRIFKISAEQWFRPKNILILSLSVAAVYGVAVSEAFLLMTPGITFEKVLFALQYGIENIMPSMIWSTKPLDLIIQSHNCVPEDFLRVLTDPQALAEHQLSLLSRQTTRSVIAGFMTLAQILRMVGIGLQSSNIYQQRILSGHESPVGAQAIGLKQRFIRLAGMESDVTRLSLERYGRNIIPIYESARHVEYLIRRNWRQGHSYFSAFVPVLWEVPDSQYGVRYPWLGLFGAKNDTRKGDFCILNNKGEHVLYMEADATNVEQSLACGRSSNDLSLQMAVNAFRMLETVTICDTNIKPDRFMRVLLADCAQPIHTGGGYTYTLREHVTELQNVDVVIDSTAPLLQELLNWCEKVKRQDGDDPKARKRIVFHTTNSRYFTFIQELLYQYGYDVIDRGERADYDPYKCPRLIYQDNTVSTVSEVFALLNRNLIDPAQCCVLLDSADGLKQLQFLLDRFQYVVSSDTSTQPGLKSICSAVIYDDIFRQIRTWTRMGFSAEHIQHELDLSYKDVLERAVQYQESFAEDDELTVSDIVESSTAIQVKDGIPIN